MQQELRLFIVEDLRDTRCCILQPRAHSLLLKTFSLCTLVKSVQSLCQ